MSEPRNGGVKTLGIKVPDSLHAQFALVAQLDGISLGDAALRAVELYVAIHISQGDIRSLDKGDNLSSGGQLLYTGTSTTAWQSYWNGGPISHGTIAQGQANAIQIKKTVYNGVRELYLTTGDHVQEYWWTDTGSGTSTLIDIAQNNIKAFDKSNDGADQQVYTASGDLVYETWWRAGVSPTSSALLKVPR